MNPRQSLTDVVRTLEEVRAEMNQCTDILEAREEYRIAFDLWSQAVCSRKRYIAEEMRASGLPVELAASLCNVSGVYRALNARANALHAAVEDARKRCAMIDPGWADEQEWREYDVENEEIK